MLSHYSRAPYGTAPRPVVADSGEGAGRRSTPWPAGAAGSSTGKEAVVVRRLRLNQRSTVLLAWVLSRVLLLAAPHVAFYPAHRAVTGDVRIYRRWATTLADGRFPLDDPSWQYPPGAAPVLALPRLLGDRYALIFVSLMVIVDAAILAVLLTRARRGSLAGAWLWIAGTAALGPILFYRFDLVPVLLVVAALAVPARPFLAGLLLGVGAVVKIWPAVLLLAARDRGRALAGAVVAGLATLAVLLATGRLAEGLDFLRNQGARGLQVETLGATPYLLARAVGVDGIRVVHEYGAFQVTGPGVSAVVTASSVAGLAVAGTYLLLARRRPGSASLGLAALLGIVLTARVLSPQYLLWVLGLAAVVLTDRASRQRRTAVLLVVAAALSQLLYPIWYAGLLRGDPAPAVLLLIRNGLLVAACTIAVRQALAVPAPAPAAPPQPVAGGGPRSAFPA